MIRTATSVPCRPDRERKPHRARQLTPQRRAVHINEFDVMRGVAILLVVYLHAYFSPWAVTPEHELITMHVTHLFAHTAVPVFLFMSGFLLARESSTTAHQYIARRAQRIVLPMMFWMLVILAWEVRRQGGLSGELLRSFALFDISGQYYYLAVLLTLTVAAYPVRHWAADRLRWLAIAAFCANLAAIGYYAVHGLSLTTAESAYRNPFVWVFFYVFGLYVARARGSVIWDRRTVLCAAAGMASLLAFYLGRGQLTGKYPVSYFGVSVFLFSCLSLIVYPAMIRWLNDRRIGAVSMAPFRALAPYAFGIYLVHRPFFIGALSDRLVSDSALRTDFLQLMLGLFVVGGIGAIAFVVIAARVGGAPARALLGVDGPRRLSGRSVGAQPGATDR